MGATYPAGIVKGYGEQLSLTTALASLGMPGKEWKQALLYCNSAFRLHVNPALLAAYIYDNSQTGIAKWIDKTRELQDRAAVGTGTAMDSFTASDRLFLCFSDITGGFRVVVNAANGGSAQSLTCNYWNGSAWTTLSATDGTSDLTRSLTATGSVTWTAPTDAVMTHLGGPGSRYGSPYAKIDSGLDTDEALDATETDITMDADPSSAIVAGDYILVDSEVMYVNASSATGNLLTVTRSVLGSTPATHSTNADTYIYNINGPATNGFWVECLWDVAMDSDTEIGDVWALNKDSNRLFMHGGVEYPISFDRRNTGAIEAVLGASTATLDVNWISTVI